jgi:malonyl-CoA/methylmalonyl-CoA synthetase
MSRCEPSISLIIPYIHRCLILFQGSAGKKVAGVDVRLSEGDQGEILIRSPYLFTKYVWRMRGISNILNILLNRYRYLHNPDATAASFDEDGYYRSGDIGRREGDYYFIMGRASVDILKSGGYKISALDVEREIIALEYVSEVMVCGVEDDDFGQRVAAAIVLKDENNASHLILDHLRADLRARLAGYKLPTLLRVISELPKTASGKVMKKALKGQLFPPGGHPDVQVWKSKEMKAHL